jgi:WD40 repeat protein
MPDDSSNAAARAGGAFPRVAAFARRFGGRHAALAMHAAFPLGLTSELVHLIRVNFVPSAPWIAEADLLLSPLCEEVGGGVYEMERDARELLLYELKSDPEFGGRRVAELAEFLLAYTSRALKSARSAERERRHFLTAQRWAALAHLRPAEAAAALAGALGEQLSRQDRAGALRVARVAQALSTPLLGEQKVLLYTAGVESVAAGEAAHARRLLDAVGSPHESPVVGTVSLPSPNELMRVMRTRAAPSGDIPQTAEAPATPVSTALPPLPPGVKLRRTLRGSGAPIMHAAWGTDTRLATASGDERVILWDEPRGRQSSTLHASTGAVTCLTWASRGYPITAGLSDGTVRVWVLDGKPINLRGPSAPITSVVWSHSGTRLAAASSDLTVRVWEVRRAYSGPFSDGPVFEMPYFTPLCLAWDAKHDFLAAGLWNGEIEVMNPASLNRWTHRGHTAAVNDVAWSPDAARQKLASASSDGTIRVWDYENREAPPRILTGHAAAVTRIAFTHDGRFLLSKSDDRTIRVWRAEDWETVAVIDTSAAQANRPVLALHPTNDTLAACYEDDASVSIFELDFRSWLKEPPAAPSATPHARVFISLSHGAEFDRDVARQISEGLSARGHQVALDPQPGRGTPISAALREAIEQSDCVIVLLSAESVRSAWLREEVALAESLRAARSRPRLLPVRLNYREPLPYYLDGLLGGLQQIVWEGPDDTPRVVAELESRLMSLLSEPSEAAAAPPTVSPSGPLAPDSPYYVARAADARAEELIKQAGVTLTIEGLRWSGRSSLLRRVARTAEQMGQRVALIDVAEFDAEALSDEERFFRHFCSRLDASLGGKERTAEYWDGAQTAQSYSAPGEFTQRFMTRTLQEATGPLLLAIDNLDRVPTDRMREFISLLRSWHNRRASDVTWRQLNLAAVAAGLFRRLDLADLFDIAKRIELTDLTRDEAAELNQRYHSPLSPEEERHLYDLLSGHPYLTQRALFLTATKAISVNELFDRAADRNGPFGEHLRGIFETIRLNESMTASALDEAGLIKIHLDHTAPRCLLYREYFDEFLDFKPF